MRESDHLIALGAQSRVILREYRNLFENILEQCYGREASGRGTTTVLSASDARQIQRMAMYGAELTERLRLHAEQPGSDLRRVDLQRVVDDSLANIDYLFGNQVRMDVRHEADSPIVRATPHALCRVITTLVVRGVERMPRGGRLTMITTTDSRASAEETIPIDALPMACEAVVAPTRWASLRVFDYPASDAALHATDSSTIRSALRAAARTVNGFGGRMEFIRRSERVAGVRVLLPTR